MRPVVADTGPLHYLVLTGDIGLLPKLFAQVLAPQAVYDELTQPETPSSVRTWISEHPDWLAVQPDPAFRPHRAALRGLTRVSVPRSRWQ